MSGFFDSAVKKAKSFGDKASGMMDLLKGDSISADPLNPQGLGNSLGDKSSGGNWQQYATPQGGMQQPQQQQDPMYSQMMQQVMQNQQPQQPQRQMMTPATMPQMPGAIAPQNNFASLIQRLLGGR